MNLLADEGWTEDRNPKEKPGFRWRRMRVFGENLGASMYELPSGQRTFPYHWELGNDELLLVITGRPTLRDPAGESELQPGDCILFPSGPAGAHQIINRTDEPARVLFVSNFAMPRSAVQPDSGKIMIRWSPDPGESLWFRREDAADYWEGEELGGGTSGSAPP